MNTLFTSTINVVAGVVLLGDKVEHTTRSTVARHEARFFGLA